MISLLQFFQACQKENDDEVKEALYKKAKCLASIEKANISADVKLSSEDLLKTIVNKAGGALKEVYTAFPFALLYPVCLIICHT